MLEKINDLPLQLEKAWTGLWTQNLPFDINNFNRILIIGMGGSGIAGMLLKDYCQNSSIQIDTWADYQLPAWADQKTLIIAVSYSGDTEETLDAVKSAVAKKLTVFAITKGGKLAEMAKKEGFAVLKINYESSPRSAIGFLYGSLLTLASKLKIIELTEKDYFDALKELSLQVKDDKFNEQAKQLAMSINNKLPIVISYAPLLAVTKRWSNQLNENSNSFAFALSLPELSHNFIAGLENPFPEKTVVIYLESKYAFSRNVARTKILQQVLAKNQVTVIPLELNSNSQLIEQLLYIYLGDLVSYYLAGIYGVDPTPVEPIQFLKEGLAKSL
ncbi:bifunctional phosphoglucose/phosphomannose isomerase [Candidatus Berkelbacteria bacterium]|nr:bifunctional phosphoglucose/phosphomannose isomerase [Candidatus Berkelbacteria bacterium]